MHVSESKQETMMDIEFARHAIKAAFRSAGELQALLQLSKERLTPEEYKDFSSGIAMAIGQITVNVANKALDAHPELKQEIEAELSAFGSRR